MCHSAEVLLTLVSTFERRIQVRSVSGVPIPNILATAVIAAHCNGYPGRTSATIRTAPLPKLVGVLPESPIAQVLEVSPP